MNINKPKLPEKEGSFFLEVKQALIECETELNNYKKETAIIFLEKHSALWSNANLMITSQVLNEFDLEDSSLLLFHDKFVELNYNVEFDGMELE